MTSNRRGLRSAADVTSPRRLAVADRGWHAINKSVSAVSTEQQNSVRNTFTSNVKVNRTCKTLQTVDHWFFDCLRISWNGRAEGYRIDTVSVMWNGYGCQRHLRSLLSSLNLQPTQSWKKRYCTTARCRQLRPVTDSETQSTRRRLQPVADTDDTVSWRHIVTRRSVCYRTNSCLLSTTTILCRHRELATPLDYAAYF